MKKMVFVGLSGGVDSSVAAALLVEQGYEVVGVYMKNWTQDVGGHVCPWEEDFQDAKRVAVQLGIDFKVYDFQKEYKEKVVDYMINQFQAGLTPNPDIVCNRDIKFKLFLDTALEDGADYIATGHYARVRHSKKPQLAMAKDQNKDQTYFLYRVTEEALSKTLFPNGELTKSEVRVTARQKKLITADRKESMGICFVGEVGIKEFLQQHVKSRSGRIIDQNKKVIGEHDGAIFYTIGQRHGLQVGGGLPFYVVGKDMAKNEVYVTTDLQDKRLWSRELKFTNAHWINDSPAEKAKIAVRMRHRAPLIPVKILNKSSKLGWTAELEEEVRALTPGQSAVFYSGEICLGGGIVV